jgi:hypothetical protein
MTDFLLKLCGQKVEGASRVSGVEFALRNGSWLPWCIALAVVLAVLAWWSYRRDAGALVSPGKRRVLTALRMLLFALLLLLLLRPVLAFRVDTAIRRAFLALVDVSASMKIADPRVEAADVKRAAIATGALDLKKGLEQPLSPDAAAALKSLPRVEVMRAMLNQPKLNLWPTLRREMDVSAFTFGTVLGEVPNDLPNAERSAPWLDALKPDAVSTALGDSLKELLRRKRGQPLAGVFVVTDGASNTGVSTLEAARFAQQEGVPLFIYGVGIVTPRDIIVGNLTTQEVAFVNDSLASTVRVRGQGLRGESAKVVVRMVPLKDGAPDGEGEVVAEKEVQFGDDEESLVAFNFTPTKIGDFEMRAAVEPRTDEASRENNSAARRIRVVDSKVKVLYVETAPRWEFRYLQSMWMRDRRLDLKMVLLEGDASLAEGEGTPFLPRIPEKREELFRYDLIVIGDVAPSRFSAAQSAALEDFVQRFGGCVLFIAGPRHAPSAFAGTVFEKLIPVELETSAPQNAVPPNVGTTAELSAQGRAHPMLKLGESEEENALAWKGFGKLFWTARVFRAKPAAQVLLVDAETSRANRHGKLVIAAEHQYGLGRVLWMGTDNTWRWRRNMGERFHTMLWGQIAQKLGMHHLLGGSKLTQLTTDKQSYTAGERVSITGRIANADYTPMRDAKVPSTLGIAGKPDQEVELRAVPDQPGAYRADFIAQTAGIYRFATKRDAKTVLEFSVAEPRFESGETAMNEAALREMAAVTGGGFFREENLHDLPAAISAKTERIATTLDGELWSSPIFFLLILLVGSLEWLLRKKWQLK